MDKLSLEVRELYYLNNIIDELVQTAGEDVAVQSDQYMEFEHLCELGDRAESGEWD